MRHTSQISQHQSASKELENADVSDYLFQVGLNIIILVPLEYYYCVPYIFPIFFLCYYTVFHVDLYLIIAKTLKASMMDDVIILIQ
jgi:hypothetical protein